MYIVTRCNDSEYGTFQGNGIFYASTDSFETARFLVQISDMSVQGVKTSCMEFEQDDERTIFRKGFMIQKGLVLTHDNVKEISEIRRLENEIAEEFTSLEEKQKRLRNQYPTAFIYF